MRFKVLIFGVVLFSSFLFSDNLNYFKTMVNFKEKHFGISKHIDKPIELNARFAIKKISYANNIGTISIYIIPFLKTYTSAKYYTYYKKNKSKYFTVEKYEDVSKNKKYPLITINFLNISEEEFTEIETKFISQEKIDPKFISINIKFNERRELQDNRFAKNNSSVQLGSLCERVLEKKEFFFLQQLPNYKNYKIKISVKDLCKGNYRIKQGCVGNDLELIINEGVVSEIRSQSSQDKGSNTTLYSFDEKTIDKTLMNTYKIKILRKKHNLKLSNVEYYSFNILKGTVLKGGKYPIDDYILEATIKDKSISLKKYYEYTINDVDNLVDKNLKLRFKIDNDKAFDLGKLLKEFSSKVKYKECIVSNRDYSVTCEIIDREIKIFKSYKIKDKNKIFTNFEVEAKKIDDITYHNKLLKVLYTKSKLKELEDIEVLNTDIRIGKNIITLKMKKFDSDKDTVDFIKYPEYRINSNDLKQLGKMSESITINGKDIKKLQFKKDETYSCSTDNDNIKCKFVNNKKIIRLSKIFATNEHTLCPIYLKKMQIDTNNLNIYLADIEKLKTPEKIKDNGKKYCIKVDGSEIKIEECKCEKIPLNIVNLDEFKKGSTYYVYLYNSQKLCENDSSNRKAIKNLNGDFIDDIQEQKVCKEYVWIKGENFSSCSKAKHNDSELKFKIENNKKERLIVVENNHYFLTVNGLKAEIVKKIKKLKAEKNSQIIIMESDGDYRISNDLKSFDCLGEQSKFSPFKFLNELNDLIEREDFAEIVYITAKRHLNKPISSNFGHIAMWRGNKKVDIYSTEQNCKVWSKYVTKCSEIQ